MAAAIENIDPSETLLLVIWLLIRWQASRRGLCAHPGYGACVSGDVQVRKFSDLIIHTRKNNESNWRNPVFLLFSWKPLALIDDKPMMGVYQRCSIEVLDEVYIATDDERMS